MTLADRRYRSRKVPRFSPSGDDQIGNLSGGGVVASRLLLDWFDMVAIRLENMMTRAGSVIMTHEAGEPEGWLLLNGQQVTERLYPRLAAIYGATDGMVTLPDMSNRLAMGAGSLVALNDTAGVSEITLTTEQMPRHNHPVIDPGHLHGAEDRGHIHDRQDDSHKHTGEEADQGNQHKHSLEGVDHAHTTSQTDHVHANGLGFTVDNQLAAGADHPRPVLADTGGEQANITIDDSALGSLETGEPVDPLEIVVSEAETFGTNMSGCADIRVHKSKSNISTDAVGDNASINILNPVRGFNFLVKT